MVWMLSLTVMVMSPLSYSMIRLAMFLFGIGAIAHTILGAAFFRLYLPYLIGSLLSLMLFVGVFVLLLLYPSMMLALVGMLALIVVFVLYIPNISSLWRRSRLWK